MKTNTLTMILACFFMSIGFSSVLRAQMVLPIDQLSGKNQMLIVMKYNDGKEYVLAPNGKKGEEFNPMKIATYDTFEIERYTFNRGENVKPYEVFTLYCHGNGKYLSYNGPVSKDDFNKLMEKDEFNTIKKTLDEIVASRIFYAIYPNKDGKLVSIVNQEKVGIGSNLTSSAKLVMTTF